MADARLDGTHIADSVIDLIGRTPLVRMKRTMELEQLPAVLAMKMETTNPGGSSKDRPALEMILAAERDGLLQPGGTIVEPTSGNTGVGLAIVAAQRGYECVFVMTDKVAPEKVSLLRAYGAEVVVCPVAVAPDDPRSYYSVAERLTHERNAFRPNQYANPNNPLAHTKTTGPEIWEQTAGRITHFVAGAGTCGTITGTARYLKQQNPDDPHRRRRSGGFGVLGRLGPAVSRRGRGRGLLPGRLGARAVRRGDRDQRRGELPHRSPRQPHRGNPDRRIGRAGGCRRHPVARDADADSIVVVLNPDSGRGYLSRVFDDNWMANYGFLIECDECVAAVLDARSPTLESLLYVNPDRHGASRRSTSCAPTA